MKKFILCFVILFFLVLQVSLSQDVKNIGIQVELGYSSEFKESGNIGGPGFFVTPSYKVGENMSVGIGTGIKYFSVLEITNDVEYLDAKYKRLVSIPLYVNTMYKFKVDKRTPFVECKLGYSFFNRNSSFKSNRLFPEHQGEVEIVSNLKGGVFFSPSIGFLFPTNNRQYFSASIAYCLEGLSSKGNFVELNKVEKNSEFRHLTAIRIGYIF